MKNSRGFTLAELLVVMGILATLFGFATVRLLGAQHAPQLTTIVDVLVNDLKQQQLRAMSGDAGTTGTPVAYGIYFSQSAYTLFRGAVYSGSDPANFTVQILSPIEIATPLPNSAIIFSRGSGEVFNFLPGAETITVKNILSNEQKTISLNELGSVTGIQ